jgi:hypothetical protein
MMRHDGGPARPTHRDTTEPTGRTNGTANCGAETGAGPPLDAPPRRTCRGGGGPRLAARRALPAGLYLPGLRSHTPRPLPTASLYRHQSPNTARSGSASGPAVGTGSRTGSHWNLHDTNTTGKQDACLPPTFETTAHEYKPYARLHGRGPHRGRLAPAEPDGSFTRAFPGPSLRADIGAPQLTGVLECTARFPLRRGPACQPLRVPRCRSLAERKRTGFDVRFASNRRAAGLFAYAQRNCR